jgi:hypothetical protein
MTGPIAFSTKGLPNEIKLASFRDAYAEQVMPCRIDPLSDGPFWSRMASAPFGDATLAEIVACPTRCEISAADAEACDPGLMIDVVYSGHYHFEQNGRNSLVEAGGLIVWNTQLRSVAVSPEPLVSRSIVVSETDLRGLSVDTDSLAGLVLAGRFAEVHLLAAYLAAVDILDKSASPLLRQMVGTQLRELVLSLLARSLRKEDPTEGRGVRAARLRQAVTIVETQYANPARTQQDLAPRQAAVDRRLMDWCDALTPAKLAEEVPTDRGDVGIVVERIADLLLLLFQHQIHHRGQIHAMLAGTSVAPPQLDEFFLRLDRDVRRPDLAALGLEEGDV